MSELTTGLLTEGRASKACVATQASYLVDGSSYFKDLHRTLRLAVHQILISGWDFCGDIRLCPEEEPDACLSEFLMQLIAMKPNLEIYLFVWDSYPFFKNSRQSLDEIKKVLDHPRIHVHGFRKHPLFGSFHQKAVCIDDRISYCGGIDLTANRRHSQKHERTRLSPLSHGTFYPIHDVHMRVEGDAALAIADIVRKDWAIATGHRPPTVPKRSVPMHIPSNQGHSLEEIPLALSLTRPKTKSQTKITEIRELVPFLIAKAQKRIYIEAQYLSSPRVTQALCEQLKKIDGPEILIVTCKSYEGAWEERTLGALRERQLRKLTQADHSGRLGVYYPENEVSIFVHSKLIIIDDRYLMMGSPNLTERSFGLDYELAITIDAGLMLDPKQAKIEPFLIDLLTEHINVPRRLVEEALKTKGALFKLIREHQDQPRCLKEVPRRSVSFSEKVILQNKWSDPSEGPRIKALGKLIPVLLSVVALGFLFSTARSLQWSAVWQTMGSLSIMSGILPAAGFTALAYGFYSSYELLAKKFFHHHVPRRLCLRTGFVSYAFTLNIGSILGGAAIRIRSYTAAGLKTAMATKIYAYSVATNWLGFACVLGVLLMSQGTFSLPFDLYLAPRLLGALAAALIVLYLLLSYLSRGRTYQLFGLPFDIPSPRIALQQLALASGTWVSMSLAFYFLFPTGLSYTSVLLALIVASVSGLVMRIPGGLGVQEAAVVSILQKEMPAEEVLGTFLVFRVIYYFVPFALALPLFVRREWKAKKAEQGPSD